MFVCGWGIGLWRGKAGGVCLSVGEGLACGKAEVSSIRRILQSLA